MPLTLAPDRTRRWTAAELRALQESLSPDDWTRYEVIDGELLVMSSPSLVHQRAVFLLARVLDVYVRAERLGEVFVAPCDLELEADNVTQPDVFIVPQEVRRRGASWADVRRLLVATEVLSPSTARYDRLKKRRYYLRNGVPEYWVVDVDARVVERWQPDEPFRPQVLDETLVWQPAGASSPFTLDLPPYFAEVHGEVPNASA